MNTYNKNEIEQQTSQSLERIYPELLDQNNVGDIDSMRLHLERYQFAASQVKGRRVLDIASGCGYGSHLIAEMNPEVDVVGVDVDPDAVVYAQSHYKLPNLTYLCGDGVQFTHEDKFDTIISLETIEHLPDQEALVKNLLGLLSLTGVMIASVPTTPTKDGNPHHLHDFTVNSFFKLFSRHNYVPGHRFEQIQKWDLSGLFSSGKSVENRSQVVASAVAVNVMKYYLKHPTIIFFRLYSILRYGFSNRYLTASFSQV